jgi:hypothetical protein
MDVISQIALRVPKTLVEISESGLETLKRAEQQQGFAKSSQSKFQARFCLSS